MVDFLFPFIKLSSLAITVPELRGEIVQLGCFHRGSTSLYSNFIWTGSSPSTILGIWKLETLGYPMVKTSSVCVPSFWHNTGVCVFSFTTSNAVLLQYANAKFHKVVWRRYSGVVKNAYLLYGKFRAYSRQILLESGEFYGKYNKIHFRVVFFGSQWTTITTTTTTHLARCTRLASTGQLRITSGELRGVLISRHNRQ